MVDDTNVDAVVAVWGKRLPRVFQVRRALVEAEEEPVTSRAGAQEFSVESRRTDF